MREYQMNLLDIDVKEAALGFTDEDDWAPPSSFPDLTNCERISIDLETCDPNLTTRWGRAGVVTTVMSLGMLWLPGIL
jgi:hypothetical protein